jgi:flagellar motor switch/type III secretory pathway protein FliN
MADTELAKIDPGVPQPSLVAAAPELPWMTRIERHASWPLLSRLSMTMRAAVPFSGFKVRDLLRLEPGQVIESSWSATEDVTLHVGAVQVAWSEFEVLDETLVVRLTRLA